ncbi:MAG: tetratricopeptide repeat protein [Brucellaceae bacterium]|nr:tetratricopeptide repeat protein [Brucellaceae bacterium]
MRIPTIIGAGALFVALGSGSAFAAGESSGGGSTNASTQCSGGKVYSEQMKKCVDPEESRLDDNSLYEAGRAFAKAGRYGDAIIVLSTIAANGDPRVLNYLGYSHRKQGRIAVGLGYYEEALRLNPDFTLAREYMGEAYLQLGDVGSARNQLREIANRCGTACDEYLELERQIDDHMKEI